MTETSVNGWLAGAGGRLNDTLSVDSREEVERRVVQPASRLDGRRRVWLDCPACGLDAGPYTPGEAGQLAGTHDDLIHRGRPTALVVSGGAA